MHRVSECVKNEEGVVLVLSVFMLALLSMIGIAAMMTGTTETDISANEKAYKIAFYEAESGLTVGAEIIVRMEAYDEVSDNFFYDDNSTVKIVDGDFLTDEIKDIDNSTGLWDKDLQHQDAIWKKEPGQAGHGTFPSLSTASAPDIAIGDWQGGDFVPNLHLDIDKIGSRHLVGGGAEFGTGSQGIGVSTHGIIFLVDCVATLPGGNAPTEHVMGFQYVP